MQNFLSLSFFEGIVFAYIVSYVLSLVKHQTRSGKKKVEKNGADFLRYGAFEIAVSVPQ